MRTRIKIGDKFKERLPSFVNGGSHFDWTYEVTGFKKEPYGDFAVCRRTHTDGTREEGVGIDIELLKSSIFYDMA